MLRLPRYGAINLHPSLLPRYRGRAPINWAILHGETELGLTAHVVDAGIDSGEIVTQRRYTLTQEQDVGDALRLLYPLYADITTQVLRELKAGRVFRTPQNHADATTFPRRTPEEGAIEWNVPAREVWNFIRAVAAPYPGAFTSAGDGVIRIWRANGIERFASGAAPQPGEVLCINRDATELMVACADAALLIQIFELEGGATLPRVGDRLTLADPATVDFLSQ